MNKLLSLTFIVISIFGLGQNLELEYISLENSNPIVIDSGVKIEIENNFNNPDKKGKNAVLKITKYSQKERKKYLKKVIC